MNELTIIVPIYNSPINLLNRCLESLDNENIEIILIDDGSNDETQQYIDKYAKTKSNMKVLHQDNTGAATARKNALKYVETEYFSFVDQDDVAHIDNSLILLEKMKKNNVKIGNGRTICYLPGQKIGFKSRRWKEEHINVKIDKESLNNVTCAFWDKIYHSDLIDTISIPSTHTQYHDMEVVYPALIESEGMVHTNLPIYEYRMRNDSSCGIELSPTSSLGIEKLLESYYFMLDIMKEKEIYIDYKNEIDAIIIKLLFLRMRAMLTNKKIQNKEEICSIMLSIIEQVVPNYKDNIYYKKHFKGAELNDYISYIYSMFYIKSKKVTPKYEEKSVNELLDTYNKKLVLK